MVSFRCDNNFYIDTIIMHPWVFEKLREKTISCLAIVLLLIGVFSTIYVNANSGDSDKILINNKEYVFKQLFIVGKNRTVFTEEGEKSGLALDDIVLKTGVDCPSCHSYTIKARDGYQQTVNWEDLENGVLTMGKRVFFQSKPRSFWVRDVVEIEVK